MSRDAFGTWEVCKKKMCGLFFLRISCSRIGNVDLSCLFKKSAQKWSMIFVGIGVDGALFEDVLSFSW